MLKRLISCEVTIMSKKCLFIMLLLLATALLPLHQASAGPEKTSLEGRNWYDGFMFTDRNYCFEFIRALGASTGGGADIGECIDTARRITEGDNESWYREWLKKGDYLFGLAEQWEKEGHQVSARETYLRASTYYRSASFFLVAPEERARSVEAWKKSRTSFLRAIAGLPYVKAVRIPYEKTTLPGYLVTDFDATKKHPLLILQTGFDGTGEELFFGYVASARERSYDCLIFEGPGQGEPLRVQNLHFRPDWEHVVTPVVDYALTLPNIDTRRIALMGISFGGYLAPRAAAYEHRVRACIANGGIYNFAAATYGKMPPELRGLIDTDPDRFNREIKEGIAHNINARWSINNGMWTFGVATPAEFYRAIGPYTLEKAAPAITCPTLVLDSEDDLFLAGQAQELYKALKCPKDFYCFTRQETAQAHCQIGATGISGSIIFNWLDRVMK
jgi:pimeloyl-ACP methyl ester carboxylesterase